MRFEPVPSGDDFVYLAGVWITRLAFLFVLCSFVPLVYRVGQGIDRERGVINRSRGTERRLILLVGVLAATGSTATLASRADSFASWSAFLAIPMLVVGAGLALSALLSRIRAAGDQLLLPVALALTSVGLIEQQRLRLLSGEAAAQAQWFILAAGLCMVSLVALPHRRHLHALAHHQYSLAFVGIALLVAPALPLVGREEGGARLSIGLGAAHLQPSEFSKILLAIFAAAYLADHRAFLARAPRHIGPVPLPRLPYFAPVVMTWSLGLAVMVAERELGTALILYGYLVVATWLATGERFYGILGLVLLAPLAKAGYELFPHVRARVDVLFSALPMPPGVGDQLTQGLFALGYADLIGTGLGNGLPDVIPAVWTDYVFSAFVEETGVVGAAALLALYVIFVWRAIATARRAPTPFLQLLAAGLGFLVAFEAILVVGGVTKSIPHSGIALPFVSYGGSSLVANWLLVGLLMRIGGASRQIPPRLVAGPVGRGRSSVPVIGLVGSLRGLSILISVLFAVALLRVGYWSLLTPHEVAMDQRDRRFYPLEGDRPRGAIVTSDGVTVVYSVRTPTGYQRMYQDGTLSHVVGYATRSAVEGIEGALGRELIPRRGDDWLSQLRARYIGPSPAATVVLEIDSRIQAVAAAGLAGHRGAVVVLDVRTGGVIASASSPHYTSREIIDSPWSGAFLRSAREADGFFIDRTTAALYPAGAGAHLVAAIAAIDRGLNIEAIRVDDPFRADDSWGSYYVRSPTAAHATLDLSRALRSAEDIYFAKVGLLVGGEQLASYARALGLDASPPVELPAGRGRVSLKGSLTTPILVAQTAAGLGEMRVSVLQMARLIATLGSGGVPPPVHYVSAVHDQTAVLPLPRDASPRRVMSGQTASFVLGSLTRTSVTGALVGVDAPREQVQVASHSATTDDSGRTTTWFLGLAPAQKPVAAIAVVLESDGRASPASALIGRDVLSAAVRR